jgi:hypothetical protein
VGGRDGTGGSGVGGVNLTECSHVFAVDDGGAPARDMGRFSDFLVGQRRRRLLRLRVNLAPVLQVLVLWVSSLSITVEGTTSCPQPGEVAARLQAVAPTGGMAGRAVLSESDGALRVQLMRPDGTVVGERLLDARYPCRELADAAAVVLASWQRDLVAPAIEAPEVVEPAAPPPPRAGLALELGLGLVAAGPRPLSAGGSLSLGGGLGAWGLRLHLMAVDFHRQSITDSDAEISWNRSPLAVTLRRRFLAPLGLVVALDGGVAAAALFARSAGLDMDQNYRALDFGPTAGAQLLFDAGRGLLPFLAISSAFWVQRRVIDLNGNDYRVLPRADSWLVLGICWRVDAS